MTAAPQWEQSVEKARLALVKTFEGRIEAALASFEQVPPGSGRKKAGDQTLAQFAKDAGVEYKALTTYRSVTKWLSEKSPDGGFSGAADVARGIGSYSTAREAMDSGKWKTGSLFATFVLENDPPEPFTKWTVDALRVHLGQKPTNTGKLALDLAAGEKVSEDDLHAAAAQDHVEEAGLEIDEIASPTKQVKAVVDGSAELLKHADFQSVIKETEKDFEFAPNITDETKALIEKLSEVKRFLELHGSDKVKDPDGGEAETQAELTLDALQAHKGEIDLAFAEVGVGASFDSLLTPQ